MGEYLSSPVKTKESTDGANSLVSVCHSNLQTKFGASSMQGWRRSMEDAHITSLDIIQGVSVFAVFDGHGGQEVAIYVEKHFIDELKKNEHFKKGNYKQALIDVFLLIDKQLISDVGKKELAKIAQKSSSGATASGNDLPYQAGCTACVALVTPTEVFVANAGDTRCVIASKGKAKNLSTDHKPDMIAEKRRIERGGGFVEEGRVNGIIAISRALGDWEYKNASLKPEENMVSAFPEVVIETLRPDHDFMIVACDGIWDCMTSQEAVNFVYSLKKRMKTSPSKPATQTDLQKADSLGGVSPPNKKGSRRTTGSSSPSKKGTVSKTSMGGSPSKSLTITCLSRIVELMMDDCCPKNLEMSEGIGADNMTCVLVEFLKAE